MVSAYWEWVKLALVTALMGIITLMRKKFEWRYIELYQLSFIGLILISAILKTVIFIKLDEFNDNFIEIAKYLS